VSGARYLLDLCVFTEMLRVEPDARVLGWLKRAGPAGLATAAVVMAELHEAAARWQSGLGRNVVNDWVRDLVEAFGAEVLPFDGAAAQAFGRLRALDRGALDSAPGRRFSLCDAQTAATAEAHGLILATRAPQRFGLWGGAVVDPWAAAPVGAP
jgi:predicted nucleic acid-binding protein